MGILVLVLWREGGGTVVVYGAWWLKDWSIGGGEDGF